MLSTKIQRALEAYVASPNNASKEVLQYLVDAEYQWWDTSEDAVYIREVLNG